MTNNAILHPWRALKIAVRRLTLRADLRAADLPPSLLPFMVGESIPLKGQWFKVGKVVGGDFPVLILVPSGATRGAKLRGLRNFRDAGRAVRDDRRAIAKSLAARTR